MCKLLLFICSSYLLCYSWIRKSQSTIELINYTTPKVFFLPYLSETLPRTLKRTNYLSQARPLPGLYIYGTLIISKEPRLQMCSRLPMTASLDTNYLTNNHIIDTDCTVDVIGCQLYVFSFMTFICFCWLSLSN